MLIVVYSSSSIAAAAVVEVQTVSWPQPRGSVARALRHDYAFFFFVVLPLLSFLSFFFSFFFCVFVLLMVNAAVSRLAVYSTCQVRSGIYYIIYAQTRRYNMSKRLVILNSIYSV